jgi:uridylate kinase
VIFAAGTGNPYFSTDTTAALRASEMHAEIILKATKVDGVYDKDPKKHADAVRFDQVSFIDALKLRLNVMDSTAFSLCMDNNVPILVFDLNDEHAISKAILGEKIGTLVRN